MEAVDKNVPLPVRDVDKPFAMPIEYFLDFRSRTVSQENRTRQVKVAKKSKSWVSVHTEKGCDRREMFRKLLDEGMRYTLALRCAGRKKKM